MTDITPEMNAEMDRELDTLAPGMLLAALKLRQFYQILSSASLPEPVILAELTAWCQGESRLAVDPMLHHIYMQQQQPQEIKPE